MKSWFATRRAVNSQPWATALLFICFLGSGFAALIYQVAWTRQFALVFGTTEIAVATVLAAYMGGLGLGAWLVQRSLPFIERPILVYAFLELIIGASAVVLVPAVIVGLDWSLRTLFGHQPEPPGEHTTLLSLFYVGGAFVALSVPALSMGATLPLIAQHLIGAESQIGRRVGALYAVNILGAVAGTLASSFWLLPRAGLSHTVWCAAAVNVIVFLLALTIAPRSARRRAGFSAAWAAASRASVSRPPSASWVLPLMFFSGAVALLHEVLWTRLLTHVLGSSLYAFGTLLATFLGGLALGGAIGATLARDRRSAIPAFAFSQLSCALAAALAYVLMNRLPAGTAAVEHQVLRAAAILMPIALFSGATFPLAVRILGRRTEDAAPAAARVYAWNTFGAIVGALSGGFVLIPWLRFEGAIQLAVIAGIASAIAATLLLQRLPRLLVICVSTIGIAVMLVFRPVAPTAILRASPLPIDDAGRILYYGVGQSATVVVLEQDGVLAFRTNGLPEALVDRRGAAPHVSGEKWLVPLALVTQPATASLLVVGYGGGVVLEDLPAAVKHVDVIEIEPRVMDANIALHDRREQDSLHDARVSIVINDARAALSLTDRRYDAIVSQPSHPWTAAASHLYTREFMRQAREHLNEQGVFVQWMNLSFLDEPLLRSLAATVLSVFSEARLYRPDPFTLVLVASRHELDSELAGDQPYARFGIGSPEDLVVAFAADTAGLRQLGAGAPLVTDDRNRIATSSAYRPGRSMSLGAMDRLLAPYDPLHLYQGRPLAVDYLARRLADRSAIDPGARDRLTAFANSLDPSSEAGYAVNAVRLAAEGDYDAAQELAHEGLARHPESDMLRYQYVRPWLTRLGRGTGTREVAAQAEMLRGVAGAVVQASGLAANRRWDDLAMIDGLLATAHWNDPWKLDSVDLRVQWRLHIDVPAEARRGHGAEALRIIDEALGVQPAIVLYALRVQSALAAGRSDAVVESVWEYGHGLFAGNEGRTGEERSQVQVTLQQLLQLLNTQSGADRGRREEVRSALLEDVRRLAR